MRPEKDRVNRVMDKKGIYTILIIFGGLFFFFIGFVILVFAVMHGDEFGRGENRIGVVEINGSIMESKKINKDIKAFVDDDSIKGILIRIDSPGGAVAPSQEIYTMVLRAAKKKKVVVSMGGLAASGGYYIAIGGDHIFANPGTITGSIGVISQFAELDEALDYLNIRMRTVKSGKFKDSGSPFRKMNAEDEDYFKAVVMDIYEEFVKVVAEERELELEEVKKLADGRVYTGKQAKELGLVDDIGSMEDAVAWLSDELKFEGEPELVYPEKESDEIMQQLMGSALHGLIVETQKASTPSFEYRYIGN